MGVRGFTLESASSTVASGCANFASLDCMACSEVTLKLSAKTGSNPIAIRYGCRQTARFRRSFFLEILAALTPLPRNSEEV